MRTVLGRAVVLVLVLILAACSENSGPTVVGGDHHVMIDGSKSLDSMINAGRYDSVNTDFTNTYARLTTATRMETMVLISFNRSISSENAIAEMRVRKLHPADQDECLAFGGAIADTKSVYDIVCLGQPAEVDGTREVTKIWNDSDYRRWSLDLDNWDGGWASDIRFLAVRD